ncbi:MAG: hypothetical protein HY299_01125 [Verrucomicrobia bacterium]|nr:hypothetical protein [Verrucomicrobiota bacterium]
MPSIDPSDIGDSRPARGIETPVIAWPSCFSFARGSSLEPSGISNVQRHQPSAGFSVAGSAVVAAAAAAAITTAGRQSAARARRREIIR